MTLDSIRNHATWAWQDAAHLPELTACVIRSNDSGAKKSVDDRLALIEERLAKALEMVRDARHALACPECGATKPCYSCASQGGWGNEGDRNAA